MLIVRWRVWRWWRHAKPALVQVHDSKPLPLALALRWLQRLRVICDVHEDNVLFVWHKGYLPRWLKPLLAAGIDACEGLARRWLQVVIAEPACATRFPNANLIPIYPDLGASDESPGPLPARLASLADVRAPLLLHTGNGREERGALAHARLLHRHPTVNVALVGYTPPAVAATLQHKAGAARDRLHLIGVGEYVDHSLLRAAMRLPNVVAGLAWRSSPAIPSATRRSSPSFLSTWRWVCQ
jgi:hypothetical protein